MIGFPKPRPKMAETTVTRKAEIALDSAETAKVRVRSGGRCEVTVEGVRCKRRAGETHHHQGGWKIRGRGESALARNKSHCCSACHREITGHVLQHLGGNRYRRTA